MHKPPDTVPSGFGSVDQILGGGLRRQDLVVLGGDVGSGKSALALAMAVRCASLGGSIEYFSGEMSAERVMERAIAFESRTTIDDLRAGHIDASTRAATAAAESRLRALALHVDTFRGDDLGWLRDAIGPGNQPSLVVVDTLQLLGGGDHIGAAVKGLKALAIQRDTTVLLLAQLPQHVAARPDPRPVLDDFGGSGAVKQTADVVLALFREEMYRPGQGVDGAAELIVLKNRNGRTGFVDLYFHAQWLRFEDMLDPE